MILDVNITLSPDDRWTRGWLWAADHKTNIRSDCRKAGMEKTAIVYTPDFCLHEPGMGHPEATWRARVVAEALA